MSDHRRTARARVALVGSIVGLLLLTGLIPAHADDRSSLAEVVASPPREASPFTRPDVFCSPESSKAPLNRQASAPGVTRQRITVVMFTPTGEPAAAASHATAPGDPATEARTFGELVNACGGVLGRKLDVEVVAQSSDARADCLRAAKLHAFVVVSWTKFAGASCIADELRTVMIASGTTAPNDTLLTTQGRLAVASTSEGMLPAHVLDLVQSGRLDEKRVAVIATSGGENDARSVRQLLANAGPSRKIMIVGSTTAPPDATADVVITTSFAPSIAKLARNGSHPISVYSLGNASDGALDSVRTTAGNDAARAVSDAGVYGWIGPELANFREGNDPTKFATMCNRAYAAPGASSTTSASRPETTTTLPRSLPEGPFLQVAEICLAWRVTARALYNAGPNPTQRSLVRALYRLPYSDNVSGAPASRANQMINEPLARAGLPVFLAKAEYPCVHPAAPKDPAHAGMCWVPASGWGDGHAVNAPL